MLVLLERARDVFDNIKKFVENSILPKATSQILKNRTADTLEETILQKFYFLFIANIVESFL